MLEDVEVDGFQLGEITGFENATYGDAFVVAPDGSRAGLVWELTEHVYVDGQAFVGAAVTGRWGVYDVGFTRPLVERDAYRENLRDIVPRLSEEWQRSLNGQTYSPPSA